MGNNSLAILVTGTSGGLGRPTVKALALCGHHVFASMRLKGGRNAQAAEEMREWARTAGVTMDLIDLDITDQNSIDQAVAEILSATGGRIDVVVNNAATATTGILEAFTQDEIQRTFENVAFGALRIDRAVLPIMRRQRSGLLLHISSITGRITLPYTAPYAAAKAALEVFAEEFRYQLAPLGIDSIVLEPGLYPNNGPASNLRPSNRKVLDEYGTLANRPVEILSELPQMWDDAGPDPQEVADAIVKLIDLPAGTRPFRTVCGDYFTAGVAELNADYDKRRAQFLNSIGWPESARS